jgi:cell division protein ZapE
MEQLLFRPAPPPSPEELVASLVPPPGFRGATFATYEPDPRYPSQQRAKQLLAELAADQGTRRSLRRRRPVGRGWYLDGGFGVGKTHLLAATFTAWTGPKAYAAFSDLANLVGAVSYQGAEELLGPMSLVAIDEFELDDPGNTVLISRLLGTLASQGAQLVVTSNTLPDRLGEGRFAADDFLREIQGLSALFEVVRIDGEDYRRRRFDLLDREPTVDADALASADYVVTSMARLRAELRAVHPIRYRGVVRTLSGVIVRDCAPFTNQADALRFSSLVDRLYEEQVPTVLIGVTLSHLFPEGFLLGGYRKTYGRCLSRLVELRGRALAEREPTEAAFKEAQPPRLDPARFRSRREMP